MANRTVKEAHTVKGTNPQFLVEKIIRHRIYDCKYWKEECFGLTAELIVDKGMDLRYIGGVFGGNIKATPFLCLSLKLLQIQPDKEIIIEFIRQEESKYIRALGAMYLRLTFNSLEIYKYLEPLFNDYRKLRYMNTMGRFELIHMDEFIDNLLREERYCDIQLPRLQNRLALEELSQLEPYVSALDEDLDKISESESEPDERERKREKPRLTSRRRSRSRDRDREERRDRDTHRKDREKERDRSRERDRRRRSPSRERDDRRDRDRDDRRGRDRGDRGERDDRRDRGKDRGDRDKADKGRSRKRQNSEEREIEEANAMRAKIGLAPLER